MDNPLHQLFLDELAHALDAERQMLEALPQLALAAQDEELRTVLEAHREETEAQVARLEWIFESLGRPVAGRRCCAMEGIIEEGDELLAQNEESWALDPVIIASAQKAEHYEIAAYGTLCTWAELLRQDEALELLRASLAEAKAADEKLTSIAISLANVTVAA